MPRIWESSDANFEGNTIQVWSEVDPETSETEYDELDEEPVVYVQLKIKEFLTGNFVHRAIAVPLDKVDDLCVALLYAKHITEIAVEKSNQSQEENHGKENHDQSDDR